MQRCYRTTLIAMWTAAACLLAATPAVAADGKSARDILDASLEHRTLSFKSGAVDLAMVIEDKAGDRRVRKLEVKTKSIEGAAHTRVELTAPKEIKGQSFLFAETKSGADNVWMYVPAFAVTRRIEGRQKQGSFLGSHLTYADLESRDLDDATYKRLADQTIGKHPVYVVESTPDKDSDSEYSKVVSYIRKSDYMPLKTRFYDDSGDVAKTLFVEKIDQTDAGEKYAKQMTIRPKDGGFTTIKTESLDPDAKLPDAVFSKNQLGK